MDISKEHALETYRSLMHYGTLGLKFVLVANGAAAVAILTFLGHYVAEKHTVLPDFRWPLGFLIAGVFLGGLGTATAYLTQLTLYNESMNFPRRVGMRTHQFWLNISICIILLGMIAFGAGVFCAVASLPRGAVA